MPVPNTRPQPEWRRIPPQRVQAAGHGGGSFGCSETLGPVAYLIGESIDSSQPLALDPCRLIGFQLRSFHASIIPHRRRDEGLVEECREQVSAQAAPCGPPIVREERSMSPSKPEFAVTFTAREQAELLPIDRDACPLEP